jgi:hypothetical protein
MSAALLCAALVAPEKPALDNVTRAKLYANVVIAESSDDGDAAGSARALAIVQTAPAAVFAVLSDHSKFASFMPRIEKIEILRRIDDGERVLQTVNASITTVKYALDYRWDAAALRLEFQMAPDVPSDIKSAVGSWQMWPLDGGKRTLVEYRVRADAGRTVPGFIKRWLQSSGAHDALEAIKKRAESGGTYTK